MKLIKTEANSRLFLLSKLANEEKSKCAFDFMMKDWKTLIIQTLLRNVLHLQIFNVSINGTKKKSMLWSKLLVIR